MKKKNALYLLININRLRMDFGVVGYGLNVAG